MEEMIAYSLRITPGLVLAGAVFFLLPKKQLLAKILVLIVAFILIRDAMTPEGLWQFGLSDTAIWIRFIDRTDILLAMGVLTIGIGVALLQVKQLRNLVDWGDVRSWRPYVAGIIAGVCVALPFLLIGAGVPIEDKGGIVAGAILPALLFVALAGNFLEELLFRGFLQSYLAKQMTSLRAALISGLLFGFAHAFLASTVTDIGWPLLVFVTIEGIVCAFVYRKYGLISATIVHGLVIFLCSAGLV